MGIVAAVRLREDPERLTERDEGLLAATVALYKARRRLSVLKADDRNIVQVTVEALLTGRLSLCELTATLRSGGRAGLLARVLQHPATAAAPTRASAPSPAG